MPLAAALGRYLDTTPPAQRIDLLMCENEALAIGAIDAARHVHGLRVPQDLAVAGYDGTDLASARLGLERRTAAAGAA